jgi:hypothetical protein
MTIATPKERVEYIKHYYHNICNSLHIFDEAKVLYITTHKVASSSIKDTIQDKTNKVCGEKNWTKWVNELNEDMIKDYYIFSFTRNPWDRMVSIAKHFSLPMKKAIKLAGTKKHTEGFYNHSIPCSMSTHNKENKQIVDFVGRFENIQEDFGTVLKEIGITTDLQFKNKGNRTEYQDYYDNKEMIDSVAKIYRNDIRLFGYTF